MNNKLLVRHRIENELKNIIDYPLTVISVTMGYGKTTSVQTFLDNHNIKYAWVSCLGCSDVQAMFWQRVLSSVGKVCPSLIEDMERAGLPINDQLKNDIFERFPKKKDKHPLVIVIDDYQLVDDFSILDTYIQLILQEVIPNLHIVLLTRICPKFNYINLISKGLCFYIDNDTLAFTLEETTAYFESMNVKTSKEEIQAIYNYTNGWISAIYLCVSGLQKRIPVSANFDISQLVNDNLYNYFDLETKQILMYLSIFDCFTLEQATKILQNNNAPQIIKNLVKQNAFVRLDKYTGQYSIHNILLELLGEKLSLSKIDLRPIYYAAGKWYFDTGEMRLAFEFYYKAGKLEELLICINDIQKINFRLCGDDLVQKISSEIPTETCIQLPFAMLQIAFKFIFTGEEKKIEKAKEIIDMLRTYYTVENVSANIRNKILGEIEVLTIFLVFNDTEKMIEHSQKADILLNGDVSMVVYRHDPFTFGIPHFLYAYYREPGKLKETVDSINRGFPPRVFDGCGTGCELVAIAEAALEQGDSATADLYIKKAIYKADTKKQFGIILCAKFAFIRLCLLNNRADQALDQLLELDAWFQQIRSVMNSIDCRTYSTTVALCEAYIYGCMKKKEIIPDWIQIGDFKQGLFLLKGLAFPCIVFGKSIMLSENWVKLEVYCETFREKYEIHHNQLGLLHNAIYDAVAKLHLYGLVSGKKTLLPALLDAQRDNILLPFAENADYILPIIYALKDNPEINPSYLSSLISLCENYKLNFTSENPNSSILTVREKEVLELLAQGLTKKEIAKQIFLSVSSIKRYIENIYLKLDVNNKQKAIIKAYELNLL